MTERTDLEQAIASLEDQRTALGDTVVDTAIAALRQQLDALDAATRDEQRKLVTVLFADLVGWTKMAERMDPEDVQTIQQAYFAAVTPAIEKHGGAVEKYIGDAVLAVFGVPQAHEDDPERAVRAALAMQEAIVSLNDNRATSVVLTSDPPTLSLRIGIHTGLVVSSVDADGDFVITGDTVNLASRLENAAPLGSVLISHDTFRHMRGLFDLEPQEPLSVKGKSDPVQTYLVQRVRPRPFQDVNLGVAGIETRMVGRDSEFLFLQDTLQDVMADGDLRMITIIGEAGVGKSRLLFELEHWADDLPEDIWYFKGRANPDTEHRPYGLLRNMLAARFNITESDTLAEVRDKLQEGVGHESSPLIGQLLGYDFSDDPAVKPLIDDPRQLREQALAALVNYFHALTEQDPVMILLEDLHWADNSSLDVLNHLTQSLTNTRLFVLAATRPNLYQRRPHWGEGGAFHSRLDLRSLSKRAGRQLVAEILQRIDQVPKSLEDLIVNGAEGNPFFVEELIKMLLDDEVINISDNENWRLDLEQLHQAQVPATLTGVIQARLDLLSAEERSVLQQASVVGSVFWDRAVSVLGHALDSENEEDEDLAAITESLVALRSREFIYRRETSTFEDTVEHTFKHAVLRDVTYKSVLKRLRRIYHGLVADWLIEQTGERICEYVGLIADHLQQAGRNDEAANYLVQAGDQARTRNAYEEAVVRYRRALSIFEEQKRLDEAARTYMKLGLSHHNACEYRRARKAYEKGFALPQQQVDELRRRAVLLPAPHALRLDTDEPVSIDPAVIVDTASGRAIAQLFCGLVALDDELTVVPDIAQRWEISEDGCRYVFHLRDDVLWSDGIQVTAADFEYAWKRLLNPVTKSLQGSMLYGINHARAYHQGTLSDASRVGVRAMDDFTLIVDLENPAGYFLNLMTHYVAFPLPKHVIDRHGAKWTDVDNIVCNGPFVLESWNRSQTMTFVRNPTYHGQRQGNVKRVELSFHHDRSAEIEMYEANELDSLRTYGLGTSSMMDRERVWQRFVVDSVPGTLFSPVRIGLDLSQKPFNDPRVRMALALATDKEAVLDVVPNNFSLPATGGFIPPGIPGHAPGIGLPYDPEQARWLLAQAGYPDGADFPAIDSFGHHQVSPILDFLQHHWRENLGISIRWVRLVWNVFLQGFQHHQPQIYVLGWNADYPDPDSFLRGGLERRLDGWNNDAFAELVREANRTTDQSRRIQLFQQADRILVQEAVLIPLYYKRRHIFVKPWVIGLTGDEDFGGWKDVIIKPH